VDDHDEVELIPQPHGGALRPGQRKGEPSRNPLGRPSKRRLMAQELAKAAGLDELVELAFQVRRRKGDVAKCLVDAATDPGHKGQVAAQRLLRDVLGQTGAMREEAKAKLEVQVQYTGKVRVMEDDPEDATFRLVQLQKPTSNGNGRHGEDEE